MPSLRDFFHLSQVDPTPTLPACGEGRGGLVLNFSPPDKSAVREIVQWRYEPPYDIYNLEDSSETIDYFLDAQYNFHAIRDENGDLAGFCSFGVDAQVPGGDYSGDALDIGMGIRPDLTGQGRGSDFVAAVLDFAQKEFDPVAFRVTIAVFNQRAQRVWQKHGFVPIDTFTFKANSREFIIMAKNTKPITN